jgi:hypothetical protein
VNPVSTHRRCIARAHGNQRPRDPGCPRAEGVSGPCVVRGGRTTGAGARADRASPDMVVVGAGVPRGFVEAQSQAGHAMARSRKTALTLDETRQPLARCLRGDGRARPLSWIAPTSESRVGLRASAAAW